MAGTHTLLIDEVDNVDIVKKMRSVLNDGHSRGGRVIRTINSEVVHFLAYGPVALAGIGKLPATLMSRSIVINMDRSDKAMARFSVQEHHYASQLARWAKKVDLNSDPQMPGQLIGRDADKWRPLIAIADSFGRSDIARDVALKIVGESNILDIKESILRDTQKVFDSVKANILTVDALYQGLLEDKEGEHEVDYVDMKMTKRRVGDILADFRIKSCLQRYEGAPKNCWLRKDFEEKWRRYRLKR